MKKEILEKQNRDLRTRLENQAAKNEMKIAKLEEEIRRLKKELETAPEQIKMLQAYIAKCEAIIDELKREIAQLKEEKIEHLNVIEKLRQAIDKIKSKFKKNSSTSDKPPSSDVFAKPKPQSMREKSGKKPGGQFGHTGHGPKLFETPTKIIEKKPQSCGNCGNGLQVDESYIRRQMVDIKITLEVIEERVYSGTCPCCGNKETGVFDDEFKGPLQYGVDASSFITMLNAYGCVSDLKTAEIINSISGGILNISAGTIVNIRRMLSDRLEETINIIRNALILSGVLGGDESGLRVNGKLKWGQIFCNNFYALYGLNGKRGDIDEGIGILTFFVGVLVHDHFKSYYNYKTITHAECNQHILRYLKGLVEIFKHAWFNDMSDLLKRMCHCKNELLRADKTSMPSEEIDKFSKEYDEILSRGWAEYYASTQGDEKKEKYYTDERCLLTRLGEYKDEHLLFLNNFDVPFSNNNSEQGIRVLKTKTKVSGGFRSDDGAEWFLRIMSLITSLRKQKMVVFEGIKSVFLGKSPFSPP